MQNGGDHAAPFDERRLPLEDIRVVDLGHALAGPFSATMLADFGADVIKVEHPGRGDPMRSLGPKKDGVPLWWKAASRNKRHIAVDFTTPQGHEIIMKLVDSADVLVENFRPGTLERHGLGWEHIRSRNRGIVMLRISGFGQEGGGEGRPGFGRIADAVSGAAYLTGFPDSSPVHTGFSLADTLAGTMGAFAVLVALHRRESAGEGECIDLALFEPLMRLIDWQIIVHDQLGVEPKRAGNRFPDVLDGVAADIVRSSDGVWLTYSSATDAVLRRLVALVSDERADAEQVGERPSRDAVQKAVETWIADRAAAEVERAFSDAGVPMSRIYSVEDILSDPVVSGRDNVITLEDEDLGTVRMHGVIPHLKNGPGRVRSTGGRVGADTAEVLAELGLSPVEVAALGRAGIVGLGSREHGIDAQNRS